MADVEQAARDVVGARDPVAALGRAIAALSAAEAVHVVESVFWRLPAFFDADTLRAAAAAHAAIGQSEPALLLDGMAAQMGRDGAGPSPSETGVALDVLAAGDPQARLREFLGSADLDAAAKADLVLRVWARLPPVTDYWVPHHATDAFQTLRREAAAMVMAGLALQLAPVADRSGNPAATLLRGLLRQGRYAAAHALATARVGPGDTWIAGDPWRERLAGAGRVAPLAPPSRAGLSARVLVPADRRPAMPDLPEGEACPVALRELREAAPREPITLYRLLDAEVVVAHDHVAVFGGDGTAYPELSVGDPPTLVRAAARGAETKSLRRAALVSDLFPSPNLCHFLCDQATKLALYARAGVDLETTAVIGAAKTQPFQRGIADRFGAAAGWVPTGAPLVVRVGQLWVLSTCAENMHPAHLGAPWALDAIRSAFGVAASGPGRRRLYVSRRDARSRRVVNEGELLATLVPAGFEVVLPGQLDVAEQAALFAQASHVVAPHGAGLTNVAFCGAGTRVLELFHPMYGTYAFAILSQAAGLDYQPLVGGDASLGGAPPPLAPHGIAWIGRDMTVDVAAVTRWLDR